MAGPTPPDPDLIAEAYRLTLPPPAGENLSLAQVGVRLGVSKATAGNYVQKAIVHMPLVEMLRRSRMQGDMTTRLCTMLYEVYDEAAVRRPKERDEPTDEWLALLDFAAKREAQLAVLLGLNAPKALTITNDGNGKGSTELRDTRLIEALERLDERDAADDRALRAGESGVIEGGSTQ